MIAAFLGLLMRPWARRDALGWRLGRAPTTSPLRARVRSVGYAAAGLLFAVRNEANMRLHLAAATMAVATGIALGIDAAEWRWLILAIALVIAGEALNTGIEQACDAIGGRSEPIRRAKDAAAGGVLVLAVAAGLIGLCIFVPHLSAWSRGTGSILPLCGAF